MTNQVKKCLAESSTVEKQKSPVQLLYEKVVQETKNRLTYVRDICYVKHNLKLPVYKLFKELRSIGPYDLTHFLDLFAMDREDWTDSPGQPWTERGYQTKGDIRDDPNAVNEVRYFWHHVKDGEKIELPGGGTKPNSTDSRRVKWKYPAMMAFGEDLFTTQLIKECRKPGQNIILGYNLCDVEGSQQLYHRFHQQEKYYIKLDFTNNTVPAWLVDILFEILQFNINFCKFSGEGVPDVRKIFMMWHHLRENFINIHTICVSDETCILKMSDTINDSSLCKLICSWVAAVIVEYLSISIDGVFTEDLVVLGDESLARVPSYWDLNKCQDILKNNLGMSLNLPKCQVSKNLKHIRFLGHKRIWMT